MMNQKPTRSGLQDLEIICIMLFLFTMCTNCKYSIRPSAFQISSQGGDGGSQHEISFSLAYSGSKSSSTLKFPVNVPVQCPGRGNAYDMNCDFQSGQTSLIPKAGEIVINDNDSFSSLHWNVKQHDSIGDDYYTLSISSNEWKMSPNQCTPYEVRIPVNISYEVKHNKCFTVNLGLTAGVSVTPKALNNSIVTAEASVGAEFGMEWQKCSEWTVPPNSYVLYANVVMDSPYPTISPVVSVCTQSRIAAKDGYGNNIYPYNAAIYSLPDWMTWDNESYIAKPLSNNIGDFQFSLGVFGPCGVKNLTTYLKVKPEAKYSAHSYTADACAAAKLEVKDVYGNVALPSSPGASLNWIVFNNQTYTATPTLAQIGNHSATLTVAGPCGAKSVNASIVVNPEKAYSNVAYTVKACSSIRLIVKNAYGVSVPPSAEPTISKTWLTYDGEDYIANPLSQDIGIYNLTLSMFSYCGSRNITASIAVTSSQDFLVDKKIINAKNTNSVSYHSLSIMPLFKAVSCKNFTSSNGEKYNWLSITEAGLISLTPSGVISGVYNFTGVCVDQCGHSKESAIEVNISNYADFLSSAGVALAAVVLAILF